MGVPQSQSAADKIYSIDVLSISVRITKEAKTTEQAEKYYKALQDMMQDLRESGLFIVDNRFVVTTPPDRIIGADQFLEWIKTHDPTLPRINKDGVGKER